MMKKMIVLTTALAGIVLVSACSDETVTDDNAPVDVAVTGNDTFVPANITVKVGQTVRWTWTGGSHNVVSGTKSGDTCTQDDKFTSGAPQAGGTFERVFEVAGSFPYYCEPHCASNMVGTVTVVP